MQLVILALFLGLALAASAAEMEPKLPVLKLKPKSVMAAVPIRAAVPFTVERPAAPMVDLAPPLHSPQHVSPSACNAERALCYDAAAGHIVFRPARRLMPDLPGLKRENISVKRDRIIFRYSW